MTARSLGARAALVAALASACLGTSPSAQAAPPLALLSGTLSVSVVPPLATLTTSGSVASGSLGTTTIVDGRLGGTGYDVSVTTSGFDLVGPPVTTSPTTHVAAGAVTAQVTATTGGTASTSAAQALPATPLFRLSYPSAVLSLNLVSTYTLALSVTLPVEAGAGRYTGTVTQTVV